MITLPHRKTYKIISGHQHGRKLGFPTLNFAVPNGGLLLEPGIYAGFVTVAGKPAQATFYHGPRHALGDRTNSFEAHLLDSVPEPESAEALVWVEIFLRPVAQFDSESALKQQIAADVQMTREALRSRSELE